MPSPSAFGALVDLAEDQWGLFTRRQFEATGMAWSTLARMLARGEVVERVAHGVYRLRGAGLIDHLELRAAWLQLAPDLPAWERTAATGLVSHRSAASVYGLGHLPADVHEFTLPVRRQSRRPDVRLHRTRVDPRGWTVLRGLPVTRPSRTAADLLADQEDPAAVGHVIADALRGANDSPAAMSGALAPYAERFGLKRGDGLTLLRWLLELSGAQEIEAWLSEARSQYC